jgi:hypothetical protein
MLIRHDWLTDQLTNQLTHFMEKNLLSEANSRLAGREIPRLHQNPEVYFPAHKSSPLVTQRRRYACRPLCVTFVHETFIYTPMLRSLWLMTPAPLPWQMSDTILWQRVMNSRELWRRRTSSIVQQIVKEFSVSRFRLPICQRAVRVFLQTDCRWHQVS